jgi:Tfp pilus assembly protein PilV
MKPLVAVLVIAVAVAGCLATQSFAGEQQQHAQQQQQQQQQQQCSAAGNADPQPTCSSASLNAPMLLDNVRVVVRFAGCNCVTASGCAVQEIPGDPTTTPPPLPHPNRLRCMTSCAASSGS